MSLKSINESFKRMYDSTLLPLNEADEPVSVKLKNKLTESVDYLQRKGNKNIQSYETAFETILEEFFPGKSWYEVTNVDIFNDLFTGRDPYKTIRSICESIKPENESFKQRKSRRLTESSNKGTLSQLLKSGYTVKEIKKFFKDETGLDMTPDNSKEFNQWVSNFLKSITKNEGLITKEAFNRRKSRRLKEDVTGDNKKAFDREQAIIDNMLKRDNK